MDNVVLGLFAIAVGALFCFGGYIASRFVIALWGAFVGFGLGAGLVASFAGDGFLQTTLGWAVGLVMAVVFAILAYFFYAVAVVLVMASVGFSLGASLMVALDVSWTWVIVLAGVGLGILLSILAMAIDLPMLLLVIVTALGGASAITTGIMLLVGTVQADEFSDEAVTSHVDEWWWTATYVVLAILGVIVQSRSTARSRAWASQY